MYVINKVINFKIASSRKINAPVNSEKRLNVILMIFFSCEDEYILCSKTAYRIYGMCVVLISPKPKTSWYLIF